MRIFALAAMGVALAAAPLAAPAVAQETRLKAASFLPLGQSFGVHFKRWVDETNRRGKGILQIDAVGPEAIPVPEQPAAVRSGVVQMYYGPTTFYTGTMWEGETLSLAERPIPELRANGAWAYLNKLHNEKMNIELIGGLGDGVKFYVYTTTAAKPGNEQKPMEGLTLRTTPIYRVFFESIGARTVSLPPGEVFTALERNVVQGYGWPQWGVKDMGWLPLTKFRYGPGFFNVNVNMSINLDAWKKLNPAQQKLLTDMGLWLDQEWPKWRADQDAAEEKIQKDAGIRYVDLGAWFSKRAQDAYWDDLAKKSPQHIGHLRPLMTK